MPRIGDRQTCVALAILPPRIRLQIFLYRAPWRLGGSSPHQRLVFQPVWTFGVVTEPLAALDFVHFVVALEPDDVGVSLEGEDVGRDPVEEPAIVADHHRATCRSSRATPSSSDAQSVDIEVVGRFVE